jgi:uncharacterized repeat protein (TIGR03803 family)
MRRESLLYVSLLILTCASALGQQYRVLYSFSGQDGNGPQSLVFDSAGNLYGTALYGGANSTSCDGVGCGTVFRLSPNSDGGWTQTVLYSFCAQTSCPDGSEPGSGLVLDGDGNIYGTTQVGGSFNGGTIFELSPSVGGGYTETVLYSFPEDSVPSGALARDATGSLYGTTQLGGSANVGTVWELSPSRVRGGAWVASNIYTFCVANEPHCPDGWLPTGGISLAKSGSLYGTTRQGGHYGRNCPDDGCGTIFELSPGNAGWTYKLLFSPPSPVYGLWPVGPIIFSNDTAYGSFSYGGSGGVDGVGVLFELLPGGKGAEFTFPEDGSGGIQPEAGLVVGPGSLYGTTFGFGYFETPGNVFQITPSGQETVLYSFCSEPNCSDGLGGLGIVRDQSGDLYGVTAGGGDGACSWPYRGCGVIFELTP